MGLTMIFIIYLEFSFFDMIALSKILANKTSIRLMITLQVHVVKLFMLVESFAL